MLSVWSLLAAAVCAVPVSGLSRKNVIHGRQLILDLPERTQKLEFVFADESDRVTIWDQKVSLWANKPIKGQVNSAGSGWTFRINRVTFDDEGTYTLVNYFGSPISSYAVKVDTSRDIIERVAGERLTIPLLGLKQIDATLRFYSSYSPVTLVEGGVPLGKTHPDYIDRLKVSSDMIQILNVNVSDLGRYELTDKKGRLVSNNTMILVDQHAHSPNKGLLALLLFSIPAGICFCCRKRICKCCRTDKSDTHTVQVESNSPVSIPCNPVINPGGPVGPGGPGFPGGPVGPGGPGQAYTPGYPPHPDQGQIHYPPQPEWSGQPAVSPGPGFHPPYVPQNPAYPPDFGSGVPPLSLNRGMALPQYNPSAPMNSSSVMYVPPTLNEPPPTAPLLTPQPGSYPSATTSVSMDILNSGDSSVQFDINKGKSSGSNFL